MKTTPRLRAPRGQAMTELALGTLVLVTILVFGIHFAEIGYLSLKVTEAASAAMWDTTSYKLHAWPNDASPANTAASLATSETQNRYQNMDGRTSRLGMGGSSISQVFTKMDAMNVQCQTGNGIGFSPDPVTTLAYSDNGGLTCGAQASITVINFPETFMESSSYFKEHHYTHPGTMTICALGRASGGACSGKFASLLDDWGLAGSGESGNNPLIPDVPVPTLNPPYWEMAGSVFLLTGAGMGIAGTQMIYDTVHMFPWGDFIPGGENLFWMSSMAEWPWFQPLPSEGWPIWPTSPGMLPGGFGGIPYTVAYIQRDNCFLGQSCPP